MKANEHTRLKILYALFFLSGVAGLVYEVMWMRSFSLVFGSTTRAAAAVLGAFFGGLAVGSLLGARLAGPRSKALVRYGVAEIAIAAGALLVDVWIGWFRHLYPVLYASGAGTLAASKLVLAFVAMGIPCVAMGTTLPLVTRAIVDWPGHLGRRVGVAYALNTFGATAGVLLAGFLLPPTLGTANAIYLAVAINIVVGAAAILLARSSGPDEAGAAAGLHEAPPEAAPEAPPPRRTDPALLFVVAASGFGTVGLEVLYTRLIVNATDSSVFSFALMLATFLVFLALASLVVSWAIDRVASPWKLLAWSQSLGVAAILLSPALFELSSGDHGSLGSYLGGLLRQLALVVGPTILLIGVALPIAWKIATRRAAESGWKVGRLTALNTLAAVAGSVITGFVLVPAVGIGRSIAAIALLYCAIAVLSWVRGYGRGRALAAAVALTLVVVAALRLGTVSAFLLLVAPGQRVISLVEGESVNVAVVEDPRLGRLMKINNSYVLGRSDPLAVAMHRNQGGLPLLLHPDPRSVAFIGVGTGVSVSSIVGSPVERVLAIELLEEVVTATDAFREANLDVLSDPRVETLVADGRNHLAVTEERFDAVVGDLFAPWQAGTAYLYTREQFESVGARLEPGGIFAQWLPAHQLAVKELRIVTATFLDVFPEAELWLSRPDPRVLGGLALVARAGGAPAAARRAAAEASRDFPGLSRVCGPSALARFASGAPLNTDEFPLIEYLAATSRFQRQRHIGEMRELISRLQEAPARPG